MQVEYKQYENNILKSNLQRNKNIPKKKKVTNLLIGKISLNKVRLTE